MLLNGVVVSKGTAWQRKDGRADRQETVYVATQHTGNGLKPLVKGSQTIRERVRCCQRLGTRTIREISDVSNLQYARDGGCSERTKNWRFCLCSVGATPLR